MFVLDTNVLSAMMRLQLEPRVAVWIAARSADLLFTTSLSQAEILSGLAIMVEGRRRLDLEAAARAMFVEDFDGRVLPFDTEAATAYASIFAARRRAGRPAATIDLMIASIAQSRGASVVTRDTSGFEGCGLTLINPWDMT
jgi:toxin FitB